MSQLVIEGELADTLEALAHKEDRDIADMLHKMIEFYKTSPDYLISHADDPEHLAKWEAQAKARKEFVGSIDDPITDLSTTVSETLRQYFRDKDANTH